MSIVKNGIAHAKAINLIHDDNFSSFSDIHYTGKSLENFVAVIIATLASGKTLVVGDFDFRENSTLEISDNDFIDIQRPTYEYNLIDEILKRSSSDSPALVTNTSGSTSTPKSVVFDYYSVLKRAIEVINIYDLSSSSKELILLPSSSTAIFFDQLLPTILVHGYIEGVELPFNPIKVIEKVRERFDYSGITPTILRLLDSFDLDWSQVQVKNIAVGGEKIDFTLLKSVNNRCGRNLLFPMYGLTETGGAIAGIPNDVSRPNESIGKLFEDVGAKVVLNELYINVDGLASGYIRDSKFVPLMAENQWFPTGDLARIDGNGNLFIIGRKKNVIISGGINIYPEEVEEMINRDVSVIGCEVHGVEDSLLGESLVATVAVKSLETFDLNQLKRKLIKLGTIKIPKKWKLVTSMEIIGLGKTKVVNNSENHE